MAGAASYAQDRSPCDKVKESSKKVNVKKQAEQYARKYKNSSTASAEIKEEVKQEYIYLQEEYNKIFEEIKNDIANGYLFIGERQLCKTDYFSKLEKLDKKTNEFLFKDRDISSTKNNKSVSIDWPELLISALTWIIEKAENAAQTNADKFYEKVAWKTYSEL